MSQYLVTKSLLDDLADSVASKAGTFTPLTIEEMTDAVDGIIVPSGTIQITSNGTGIDVSQYAAADVSVSGGTPNLQNKTVFPNTVQQTITADSGYDGLGTVTFEAISPIRTSLHVSGATVTAYAGYYDEAAVATVASGTVTSPSTISGSSATVSTGDNTLTLSKTVSVTPSVTTAGYVSSGTAGNSSVSLTASVTTKAAATITPDPDENIVIAANTYLTGAQTISKVQAGTAGTPVATKGTVSNHAVTVTPSVTNTSGWINGSTKTGTAVSVSASELVSGSETKTVNGTYDVTNLAEIVVDVSGGGSSTIQVGTATKTLTAAASSISFTGLSGNPTSFAVTSSANITTNTNGVSAVVYDGTYLHGQTVTTQAEADTGFSKSYSSGTLTITATTAEFQANEYKLVYTYNGASSDIHTADVQVGSGATSITFSSLSGRPIYWSCIFKSDFSTSSGYQRVIEVVNDGTSIYGMAMDSSAKAQTSWSQTYSGGNLTISSTGTNNGGYFHQPGYYQLTYAVDASAPQYQTKTVSPSTSQQTVLPDNGYDALEEVIVNAMPSMTLPNSASATSSGTSKATITPTSSTQYLNIPTGYNATAQYYTIGASSGGGGGSWSVSTTTWNNSSNTATSHQFTSLSGTPKAAVLRCTSQLTRSSSNTYYYIADIIWDGTNAYGNYHLRSNGSYNNVASNATSKYTVTTGTNSITFTSAGSRSGAPGSFYNGTYELTYWY